MARSLHYNSHPWTWSACSRDYLSQFFDSGKAACLLDKPKVNLLLPDSRASVDALQDDLLAEETGVSGRQAGEIFDPDYQCQLVFGSASQICPYMPPCRRLWCRIGSRGGCRTQHMPWADGSECGSKMWCQRGKCVLRTKTRAGRLASL